MKDTKQVATIGTPWVENDSHSFYLEFGLIQLERCYYPYFLTIMMFVLAFFSRERGCCYQLTISSPKWMSYKKKHVTWLVRVQRYDFNCCLYKFWNPY